MGPVEGLKHSCNEWSLTLRADKVKIRVVKSDMVDVKERAILNPVTT